LPGGNVTKIRRGFWKGGSRNQSNVREFFFSNTEQARFSKDSEPGTVVELGEPSVVRNCGECGRKILEICIENVSDE
jgi:hypothetical protein